jgi:hypothetical protein
MGLCALAVPKSGIDVDDWIKVSEALLPNLDLSSQPHPPGSWEDVIWDLYWKAFEARATTLLRTARGNPTRLRVAEATLQRIASTPGAATSEDMHALAAVRYALGVDIRP